MIFPRPVRMAALGINQRPRVVRNQYATQALRIAPERILSDVNQLQRSPKRVELLHTAVKSVARHQQPLEPEAGQRF